ncbi:SubName: Full=Uncharacterized protein {ECO:0000313/EMBL:CCA69311.1} [Serendipita indica DSM 11827]|uniref:F-box domain-containing protein n=1 Tax=Serendipita indica (strain DSM 11827) TaxID=1109443 RepID=G4TDB8_SERID|nr:SubName: Full=Uncharacterized protein {ECO:0000313/EMBL:CCA69311.1} [Serendipita indica DSM 11827]CCA69311.1 hypothetical protein PIIN_03210 [Serendipita indica DSM 11827]
MDLKPRISHLPVEIWEIILKLAISVPLFFESDPILAQDLPICPRYYNSKMYWGSERTRNALRRVCSSWNQTLKPFAHRFINTEDILHGNVPISALPLARRLLLMDCWCKNVPNRDHLEQMAHLLGSEPSSSDPLHEVDGNSAIPWNLRILHISRDRPGGSRFLAKPNRLCNLESLIGNTEDLLEILSEYRPALKHITRVSGRNFDLFRVNCNHLTSLQLGVGGSMTWIPPETPSLRYLDLSIAPAISPVHRVVIDWLQSAGKHLVHFLWRSESTSVSMKIDIWDLLPLVETLSLPVAYPWSQPKSGSSIRTLYLHYSLLKWFLGGDTCKYCGTSHKVTLHTLSGTMEDYAAAGVMTIRVDESWRQITRPHKSKEGLNSRLMQRRYEFIRCFDDQARAYGMTLVDSNWRTLLEYRGQTKSEAQH